MAARPYLPYRGRLVGHDRYGGSILLRSCSVRDDTGAACVDRPVSALQVTAA